jgi:fission process protein 1
LPFIFDKPIEHAVEWTFHKGFELVGGPSAVSTKHPVAKSLGAGKPEKEKEL